MPVLRMRKSDGGYYARGGYPGSSIITWQITPEGVQFLRSRGYTGANIEFPMPVLQELIERKFAYTHGSGVDLTPPPLRVTKIAAQPALAPPPAALTLVFAEDDLSWQLTLRVPEIPPAWSTGVASLADALSGWWLQTHSEERVPATRLWPGRGGAQVSVEPQIAPYGLLARGRWPERWDVAGWLGAAPGMSPGITLFDRESGGRLAAGAALSLGCDYIAVVHASGSPHRATPPDLLKPEYLGPRTTWHAWSIQTPASADDSVRRWCESIGYRLAAPRYRLALVTPPRGHTAAGAPVVAAGEEIVLSLTRQDVREDAEQRPSFYTVRFEAPGAYRIAIDDEPKAALHLTAERRTAGIPPGPAPLVLTIESGSATAELHGLRDGHGPHSLTLPTPSTENSTLRVLIHCAVPFCLTWRTGEDAGLSERLSADEAGARLNTLLHDASERRGRLEAALDAGAYGRIALDIAFVWATPEHAEIPAAAVRRARWLVVVLAGARRSERMAPLPRAARTTLARLSLVAGCESLRGATHVPTGLIPHIHVLARLMNA